MSRILKICVLFVFTAGAVFVFAAEANFTSRASANGGKKVYKGSSRSLYANNCARCHGSDGKGNNELGILYNASDLTSRKVQKMSKKKMARIIKNGSSGMPAFGKKLNLQEINSLVNFVYSLN